MNEKKLLVKPQYHYFYGSTDDNVSSPDRREGNLSMQSEDQVSLVGEELILTEDEENNEINEKEGGQ